MARPTKQYIRPQDLPQSPYPDSIDPTDPLKNEMEPEHFAKLPVPLRLFLLARPYDSSDRETTRRMGYSDRATVTSLWHKRYKYFKPIHDQVVHDGLIISPRDEWTRLRDFSVELLLSRHDEKIVPDKKIKAKYARDGALLYRLHTSRIPGMSKLPAQEMLKSIDDNLKARSYQRQRGRFEVVSLIGLSQILYPEVQDTLTVQDKRDAANMVGKCYRALGFDKDDRDRRRKYNFNILDVHDVKLGWDREWSKDDMLGVASADD